MKRHLLGAAAAAAVVLWGCDGGSEPAAPSAETPASKCPKVSMDGLAGHWILYAGKAVPDHRFQVVQAAGGGYELWLTAGGFTKLRLAGETRSSDIKFTEVPTADREARYKAGALALSRLYVEPRPADCSLRVTAMDLQWAGDKEVERAKGTFQTYVELPAEQASALTFRPCDGPLFIGDAAKDKKVADQQLAESGAPSPGYPLGEANPLGVPGCTYDMDLYFDDKKALNADKTPRGPVAAGAEAGGQRHWFVGDWYAPYPGNHHFEVYRYRTCAGAERTLIGVNCLEAVR